MGYPVGMPTDHNAILAWRSLHLADRAVGRMLDNRLVREARCSLLEYDLLAWLKAAPQRRRQMLDLAHLLGVTRGGLTRIVDRLVARGWVERERPASNRREVYAVLTAQGRHAIEHARTSYVSLLTETLGAQLDADELDELRRITDKLLSALTDRDPQCEPAPRR
jgi:DNA-binding MarR family transcriptional regulator